MIAMPQLTGLCECGCGRLAPIATHTHNDKGIVKGQPLRFVKGHNSNQKGVKRSEESRAKMRAAAKRGPDHPSWSGGRKTSSDGYVYLYVGKDSGHPMVDANGYVAEHRLVMSKAFGRPLASSESVHHINGDRADNRLENLQLRGKGHGAGQAHVCLDCGSSNIKAVELA